MSGQDDLSVIIKQQILQSNIKKPSTVLWSFHSQEAMSSSDFHTCIFQYSTQHLFFGNAFFAGIFRHFCLGETLIELIFGNFDLVFLGCTQSNNNRLENCTFQAEDVIFD